MHARLLCIKAGGETSIVAQTVGTEQMGAC